ncbi:aldehyde dehydrogenase (NADP(+)) [Sphingomonas sp. SUN039]|nr:aldehyde dehydrogenase (NADP(+)) [Sphingomonas sp. SUN039]UVO55672.1 aldehyde dehydrogenase (NADP(+)) [Sphingomonas sp. SUN039]
MDGRYFIGSARIGGTEVFKALAAADGTPLEGDFAVTPPADLAHACTLADAAFDAFRETTPEVRGAFLDAIAAQLEARGDRLITRAMAESGLPQVRLTGELGRTTGQLRLFARLVREGDWAGIVRDRPLPDRQPLPRPDLRQRRIAVGPVAVFGASNFPLAFSVAGGDTASALAAGCPVVVKAHPAHPGTSVLAAEAIAQAVVECGLPEGVFSLVQGPGNALGAALVADPRIKAVGFTGSRLGGLALVAAAQARPEPIPVYAEMSSVNPVILFPAALAARAEALGAAYAGSLTLGAGQFCTNPGIVFALEGPDLDRFTTAAAAALGVVAPQTMLTKGIAANFREGSNALAAGAGVQRVAQGGEAGLCGGSAALFAVSAADFRADPALADEVFGPSSLIVRCADMAEVAACLSAMEGQLTATLHIDAADHAAATALVPLLERKAGRLLVNGWPTGVEVSRAMVHGGPFPATSDSRTTSVGTAAIERFLRPVCYQGFPDDLLPLMLNDANLQNIPHRVFD